MLSTYYCVTNKIETQRSVEVTDVSVGYRPTNETIQTSNGTIYKDWLTPKEIADVYPELYEAYFQRMKTMAIKY